MQIYVPHNSMISLLGIYPREINFWFLRKLSINVYIIISKIQKQFIVLQWTNYRKTKDIHTQRHYVGRKKSVSKHYIIYMQSMYVITFVWYFRKAKPQQQKSWSVFTKSTEGGENWLQKKQSEEAFKIKRCDLYTRYVYTQNSELTIPLYSNLKHILIM